MTAPDTPDTVRWDEAANRYLYRPQPHEIPDGQQWNPHQWAGLGRFELEDGTPVPDMGLVAGALDALAHGGSPAFNEAAALADRVAQLEGELARADEVAFIRRLADLSTAIELGEVAR